MTIDQLTQFLGWCTLINLVFIVLTSILLVLFRASIGRIHQRLTGVSEPGLYRIYFQYLAAYKILFLVFNLVPYMALKLIA